MWYHHDWSWIIPSMTFTFFFNASFKSSIVVIQRCTHKKKERRKTTIFLSKWVLAFNIILATTICLSTSREREHQRKCLPANWWFPTWSQSIRFNILFNIASFTLMILHLYSSSSTYIRRLGIGDIRQCKSYMWRWRWKAQI